MGQPVTGIGKCLAEYRTSASGYAKLVALMVVFSAIGGAIVWGSVASGDSNIGGRVIGFILGLLFLVVPGLGIYGLTRGRKNAVRIHENGVVVHRAGVDYEVLFDAVDAYSDGSFLEITTRDEQSITAGLDGLANAKDLFLRLREEVVVKRQVPEVLKELAAGEVAEFGTGEGGELPEVPNDVGGYALDANGITVATSQRCISWNEIVEFGSTSRRVPALGRHKRTAIAVFLKTSAETVEAIIEPLSERELLLALCQEMKAKSAASAAERSVRPS